MLLVIDPKMQAIENKQLQDWFEITANKVERFSYTGIKGYVLPIKPKTAYVVTKMLLVSPCKNLAHYGPK